MEQLWEMSAPSSCCYRVSGERHDGAQHGTPGCSRATVLRATYHMHALLHPLLCIPP